MPAPYPLEFRQAAVRLLRSGGKPVPQLGPGLGVSLQRRESPLVGRALRSMPEEGLEPPTRGL